jgi:cell division protein FtsI/penicillin-binding protein 2
MVKRTVAAGRGAPTGAEGLDGVVNMRWHRVRRFGLHGRLPHIGKTGTAQVTGSGDQSWFVCVMNPENNPNQPQYVVLAMVEHGGRGGRCPIVRRVVNFTDRF